MVRIVRFTARGFVVVFFVIMELAIWFAGWLALLVTLRGKARRQAWLGRRLTALFIDLGATFVKVGQIMSTRPDLLPPHIIRALARLQDDVGAFAYRHIERTFVEDFGKRPDDLFTSFERAPLASASVAQVHHAVLPDGTEVAVKVRRPRIENIVAFDLTVMRLFARLLQIIPTARLFAPVESVDEFGRAIRMQIDLRIEVANNRRFADHFAGSRDVTFPALVDELCSSRVLTMSYLRGSKILEIDRTASDPARLARIGFRTLLQMVFEDGFVHADLHPGNLLVVPGEEPGAPERVGILDLGLVAELDVRHRVAFASYFGAWAQGDGKVMARLMYDLSPSAHVADYSAYEHDVAAFVAKYHGKLLGQVQVSAVAFDMMNILRRHRVRVNATFTMCNIAIAVTEGIGKQLAPDLDLMREALPFFLRLQQRGALSTP